MSGPEVQANAIWTALHGLPLRSAPDWAGWLAIAAAGPRARRSRRCAAAPMRAVMAAPLLAAGWLVDGPARLRGRRDPPGQLPADGARARHRDQHDERVRVGARGAAPRQGVLARGSRRRCRGAPRSCAGRSSRSSRAWPAPSSRATPTPARTSTAWRSSASGWRWRSGCPRTRPSGSATRRSCTTSARSASPTACCASRGRFDGAERALMQTHAAVGAEILDGSDSELIQLAAHHRPLAPRALGRHGLPGPARGRGDPAPRPHLRRGRRLRRAARRAHLQAGVAARRTRSTSWPPSAAPSSTPR